MHTGHLPATRRYDTQSLRRINGANQRANDAKHENRIILDFVHFCQAAAENAQMGQCG